MKNQYFADRNDHFKYDLLLDLLEIGFPSGLTLIPMLTPNEPTGDGASTDYPSGHRRKPLYEFLQTCARQNRRDIRMLRDFFASQPYPYTPYKDDSFFVHGKRQQYFDEIPHSALSQALIFVDPDIGLERKAPREKHVRYGEISSLLDRMDATSALVVYQHLPLFEERVKSVRHVLESLRTRVDIEKPMCVFDSNVGFLVMSRDETMSSELNRVVGRQATKETSLRVR